jgi:hypothetical protein
MTTLAHNHIMKDVPTRFRSFTLPVHRYPSALGRLPGVRYPKDVETRLSGMRKIGEMLAIVSCCFYLVVFFSLLIPARPSQMMMSAGW